MEKLRKKIANWSTTKKSFYFAIVFMAAYVATNLVLNWMSVSVDDALTAEVFTTIRLIITSGGVLTGAKMIKNNDKKDEAE